MKILGIKSLAIPEVKVIRFARFCDNRGYFTEHYRKSDFENISGIEFIRGVIFYQMNESYSMAGTIRGLHFQWNPYMGKLVRTLRGRMIDLVLDIRIGSETYGKIIMYDMPSDTKLDYSEWIWVPPGFAHGNVFPEESAIEYFCSGEYSPGCEAGISPLSEDIDWSIADKNLKKIFNRIIPDKMIISEKDRNGLSLKTWGQDERSKNFIYGKIY